MKRPAVLEGLSDDEADRVLAAVLAFTEAGHCVDLVRIGDELFALATHPVYFEDGRNGRPRVGTHYEVHAINPTTGRTKVVRDRSARKVIGCST